MEDLWHRAGTPLLGVLCALVLAACQNTEQVPGEDDSTVASKGPGDSRSNAERGGEMDGPVGSQSEAAMDEDGDEDGAHFDHGESEQDVQVSAGTGGSTAGGGGSTGGYPAEDLPSSSIPLEAWGPFNPDCPEHPPFGDVRGGPRGRCCYRGAPNRARVREQSDRARVVTEYRLNHLQTVNHPYSLGLMPLIPLSNSRADYHEWNMLWRLERPYADGELVAGPGFMTIGWGGYNCDGTHSYYGSEAAPIKQGATFPQAADPSRWERRRVNVDFPAPESHVELRATFANRYQGNVFTPLLNAETFALEWEMVTRGLVIESIDLSEGGLDCMGTWSASTRYHAEHHMRSYVSVEDNHHRDNGIPVLQKETLAQLMAFGVIASVQDLEELNPLPGGTPRCQITDADLAMPPRMRSCPWIKLPTALCPTTDVDRAFSSCHLGAVVNGDGQDGEHLPVNCSLAAPDRPRDGEVPEEGQCCDPLGAPDSGLPACNAWLLRDEYVAAAAHITDALLPDVAKRCPDFGN